MTPETAAVHKMHEELIERPRVLIKGAGDLATGVALRLHRAGFLVVMTELEEPTVVRRTVSFAQAVYERTATVEGTTARCVDLEHWQVPPDEGCVAVIAAPDETELLGAVKPMVLVDAIIAKRNLGTRKDQAPVVIAVGPGFVAGDDCHAVIESQRGHDLGRVLLRGSAAPNTGIPGDIIGCTWQRVVRSPTTGVFRSVANIGDAVRAGDVVGRVGQEPVHVLINGTLRGLLHSGLEVTEGFKLGDVDPRGDPSRCFTVSDKARAVAGGVLEAACSLLGGVRIKRNPKVRAARDFLATDHSALRLRTGDSVTTGNRDGQWEEHVWVSVGPGRAAWVPEKFIEKRGEEVGVMLRDYDSSELTVVRGDELEVVDEAGGWWLCRTPAGVSGWVPRDVFERYEAER
jgi:xanthine dehydrogenase accessory factor